MVGFTDLVCDILFYSSIINIILSQKLMSAKDPTQIDLPAEIDVAPDGLPSLPTTADDWARTAETQQPLSGVKYFNTRLYKPFLFIDPVLMRPSGRSMLTARERALYTYLRHVTRQWITDSRAPNPIIERESVGLLYDINNYAITTDSHQWRAFLYYGPNTRYQTHVVVFRPYVEFLVPPFVAVSIARRLYARGLCVTARSGKPMPNRNFAPAHDESSFFIASRPVGRSQWKGAGTVGHHIYSAGELSFNIDDIPEEARPPEGAFSNLMKKLAQIQVSWPTWENDHMETLRIVYDVVTREMLPYQKFFGGRSTASRAGQRAAS